MKFSEYYSYLPFDKLINLEARLDFITRESWSNKITFELVDLGDEKAILMLDDERKNLVILDRIRHRQITEMGIAHQIVFNWLLGQTRESQLPKSVAEQFTKKTIGEKEIRLFLQGSEEEGAAFQSHYDVKVRPSLGWKLYFYPCEIVGAENVPDLSGDWYTKKYSGYTVNFVYGVVSKSSHVRADKKELVEIASTFLQTKGYHTSSTHYSFDCSRNGEPIVLWESSSVYSGTDFKTLVGINFGFDNGFSSTRLGIGICVEEELRFCQINRKLLSSEPRLGEVDSAFEKWIHHKSNGDVAEQLRYFLENQFDVLFDSVGGVLIKAKSNRFSSASSALSFLDHTHTSSFSQYHAQLTEAYDTFQAKYGHTRYAQFLAWNGLANKVLSGNSKLSSMAEWIAACVITPSVSRKRRTSAKF